MSFRIFYFVKSGKKGDIRGLSRGKFGDGMKQEK